MNVTFLALAMGLLSLIPPILTAQDQSENNLVTSDQDSITLDGWAYETFPLPPGFAPSLPQGTESLRFAPGWRDPESENFWSYAFVMWIDESTPNTARVDELLESYYSGLMSAFGVGNKQPAPDDHVQAEVIKTSPNQFQASMNLIDGFATFENIELHVIIETAAVSDQQSTVRIQISHQPNEHKIWRSLDTAIDSILAQALLLDNLKDRAAYALLDQPAVESIALAAKHRWQHELDGFKYLHTERFAAGGTSHWISIWLHESTQLEFALVPGGKFQMGSPATETNHRDDEQQHWVKLDPFLIARTECTQEAWAKIAKSEEAKQAGLKGDRFDGSGRLPISGIGRPDVEVWCHQTNLTFPTEAQWEYMCRAGTTTAWTVGDDKNALIQYANLGSLECPEEWKKMKGITEPWRDGYADETAEVGTFSANAFGLFDVHGNLNEWVRDSYSSYENPTKTGTGERLGNSTEHSARGGNFGGDASAARSAKRLTGGQGTKTGQGGNNGFGFRPSKDLPF